MEIRRTWTFRKHFAYQQIDLIAMREKHCGYSLWLCCHQSEGTSTCWWLGCNSCQAVMALYASHLNQLCPSVSWINPPLFQLYSEFSFKNLSICSMKHLVFMADISAAESFLCDFFTLVHIQHAHDWHPPALLFSSLGGRLKAEELLNISCFPHKHLTELRTTLRWLKSEHPCPK